MKSVQIRCSKEARKLLNIFAIEYEMSVVELLDILAKRLDNGEIIL